MSDEEKEANQQLDDYPILIVSALQTKTNIFANGLDGNEPSHEDLHCLPFCV